MESMQCTCYLGNRPEHRQRAISGSQKNSPIMLVNKVHKSTNQKQSKKVYVRVKPDGTFLKEKKKKKETCGVSSHNYVDLLSKFYEQVSLQTQTVRK